MRNYFKIIENRKFEVYIFKELLNRIQKLFFMRKNNNIIIKKIMDRLKKYT